MKMTPLVHKYEQIPLLSRVLPFVDDVQTLTFQSIKNDLIAAISVALIAIPQVMGYAVIAGLPPQYGLYAMTFAVMVAALWGSSRFLVAGPTNAISIILFATVAQASIGGVMLADLPITEVMPYVFSIAVLAGLIQVILGLANLGSLANYISHSVMVAFSTGAALLIFSGQLDNILQLDIHGANFFGTLATVIKHIPHINFLSLSLGLFTIAVILLSKRISAHIPAYLCALFIASLLAHVLNLQSHGLIFVSPIPAGLPPLSVPQFLNIDILRDIFDPALAIAMLGAVESITIGKNLASTSGSRFDASRELVGQGLGNIVAGFSSGIPGCGSFSRSSLSYASGASSRFASFFVGLLTLPIIAFFAPLADKIPMASLAGILIYIAFKAIDKNSIRFCLVATKIDRIVFIVTVFACLLIDLEKAVFLGILLSLSLFVYKESHPRVKRFDKQTANLDNASWLENTPHLEIYFLEGTLFFGSMANLDDYVQENKLHTKIILLNLSRVFWVDAAGAHGLGKFAKHCKDDGIGLIVVTTDESVRATFERTKVFTDDNIMYDSFEAGLERARELLEQMNTKA